MNFHITKWLDNLATHVKNTFGDRLLYIGHTGSYARDEATEESDIDVNIVLDTLTMDDLQKYRCIIKDIPFGEKACGFICGKKELQHWPAHELFQFIQGCKILYGSLEGIIKQPIKADIEDHIRNTVSAIYHELCHRYIYCSKILHEVKELKPAYKTSFFILQEWVYLNKNMYIPTKRELLTYLNGLNLDVLDICINWDSLKADLEKRPEYYFSLLKDWCSKMICSL